jgi:aminopeptidase N
MLLARRALRRTIRCCVLFAAVPLLFSALQLSAQSPGVGVSHELAIARAQRVSGVRYALHLDLEPKADILPGIETLTFTLASAPMQADLALDFRDGEIKSVQVNGTAIPTALQDGHLLLPGSTLRTSDNKVELAFTSRIATAGAAITRYDDKEDGSEYLYSLFVPMDASMAFPCFDQPDLKARFMLEALAPAEWTVLGNTRGERVDASGKPSSWRFPETKPISTYLFAFAAGRWTSVHPTEGKPQVWVRRSQLKRAEPEIPQLQDITARGMAWLTDYFQQPFPFPKYDILLIPGFPFGGMEHAGATFLREDAVLFRSAPTASDRFGRNTLTLHELTHQWFGDLVTMRWFDDLWLKEGFAQYMAYRAQNALEPNSGAWKHFYEDIKPLAYGIDETQGTTPIFQDIPNLKDAKSAYGAIVYQKAPSILKQLEFRLGETAFRDGLRLYLKQHAYANAQWSDLVDALHTSSGQDVRAWADAWVLRRGMPEVTTSWSCDAQGKLTSLTLHQSDVLPDGFVWPITNEVLLGTGLFTTNSTQGYKVAWSTAETTVPQVVGKPCPDYVFANAGDEAYGRFLLDEKSEHAVLQSIVPASATAMTKTPPDPLLRSMLWGSLWENVRTAKSAPRSYVELAMRSLPNESDETLSRIQGGHSITALHFYMGDKERPTYVPKLEAVTTDRMLHAPTQGLRIIHFRLFNGIAETPAARTTLKHLLAGELTVPGVELRPLDRWSLVGRLITQDDPEAAAFFDTETKRDTSDDGQKFAYAVQAGSPTAQAKQAYFADYLKVPPTAGAKQEDWLSQSLGPFNAWNQGALTLSYLQRSLDQLPEIKRDRKIFYLGVWLGAFLNGQSTLAALDVVHTWLAQPGIDPDLRRKVLEYSEELERTVRIRQRFPD